VGTVAFSRLNSTIQTYDLADDVGSTNITAAQLLTAFEGFLTGRSSKEKDPSDEIFSSFLGGASVQAGMGPLFIAQYFATSSIMYGTNNAAARDAIGLYSLIAYGVLGGFVLFLCVAALLLSIVFTSAARPPAVMTAYPDRNHRQLHIENLEHLSMDEWGNLEDKRLQEGFVTLLK
jgi:hypothetical protein